MLISLNWIRDFVDLPADLDVRALAEQFTCTTAEVEGVEHLSCAARGLIAAEVLSIERINATQFAVKLNAAPVQYDSVTIAEGLKPGDKVIYAPLGAILPGVGEITKREVSGRPSAGMIVPGDALGLHVIAQRAVWLPPHTAPGTAIDTTHLDDSIIEVDNKSITHRPDLWGHYGVAREIAAMRSLPLKPYPVTPLSELSCPDLPDIPIVIDDPARCPRYSGLKFSGVRPQPAPLWVQVRLAHVGMRPIDVLVDLTNYIMAELGQPMHAFDGDHVDRIEVAAAQPGEKFVTLDGMERTLPSGALMIQSHRRSVALAGVMGGADTEVKPTTKTLLLESANFDPSTIRKCASALGHRTEASARFEKSLDPNNTVLAIQRFVYLARPELPEMKLTSRLSDAFPSPPAQRVIRLDPQFVGRYLGRAIQKDEIRHILHALAFDVKDADGALSVTVPSFRATKDITIEVDLIEEVARCLGYGSIAPMLPTVQVRYAEPAAMTQLERRTLQLLCGSLSYAEIHSKIWFQDDWLRTLQFEPGPTIRLRNPAAVGSERLRTTLVPDLLAAIDLNRRHAPSFELIEIGSVFPCGAGVPPVNDEHRRDAGATETENRHMALAAVIPGRKPAHEDELIRKLKVDLETWAFQTRGLHLRFGETAPNGPWEDPAKTAVAIIDGKTIGRLTVVPAQCKRNIDEHLSAWSIAIAEIDLSKIADRPTQTRKLASIPTYPNVDVDFSVLVDASRRYAEIEKELAGYDHPLLKRLAFVDSYEGGSIPAGQRSFLFRSTLSASDRTLTDEDVQQFRADFIDRLGRLGLKLRA